MCQRDGTTEDNYSYYCLNNIPEANDEFTSGLFMGNDRVVISDTTNDEAAAAEEA